MTHNDEEERFNELEEEDFPPAKILVVDDMPGNLVASQGMLGTSRKRVASSGPAKAKTPGCAVAVPVSIRYKNSGSCSMLCNTSPTAV